MKTSSSRVFNKVFRHLPLKGIDIYVVLRDLYKRLKSVPNHLADNIVGSMTTYPHPLAELVFLYYHFTNANDIAMYSKIRELEIEAIRMLGEILSGSTVEGMITSGGSEANLSALYIAREHGYRVVYVSKTAHDSIFKACRILSMKTIHVDVNEEFEMDISDLESKVCRHGPGIVVTTAGTTGIGSIDPVWSINKLCKDYGCIIHVDAAYGGLYIPFIYNDVSIGFDNETVMSVTLDPHKLGMAPIPSGSLIVRDSDWFQPLVFESRYMPLQKQIGLLGTRTGGSIAAVWALLKTFGFEGYRSLALKLKSLHEYLLRRLDEEKLKVVGRSRVPIVCIGLNSREIEERILECLWNRGIYVYRCGVVPGIRVVLMPHTTKESIDGFLENLIHCIHEFSRRSS